MAFISCGNQRKAKYQKHVFDVEVIPDKHNCGCHGDLVSYETIWTQRPSGDKPLLRIPSNVATYHVSNAYFKGFSLYFNSNEFTSNFVFENCLFDAEYETADGTAYGHYNLQIYKGGNVHAYFINCTFTHSKDAVNNGGNMTFHFIRCLSLEQGGDHFKAAATYEYNGCYTIGGSPNPAAHADGYQFQAGKGYIFENYRSEMIPLDTAKVYQACNCCAFTGFESGEIKETEFVYVRNAVMNGAGVTLSLGADDGYTLTNTYVHNSFYGCAKRWGGVSVEDYLLPYVDCTLITTAFVSSVWKENGVIHFLASNYTNQPRTIIAVDASDNQTTFTIDACPTYSEYSTHPETYVTQDDFPFDVEYTLTDSDYVVFYDTSVSEANQIRFADTF